jgi:hypothetical protein
MNPTTLEFILSSARDVMNVFTGIQQSQDVFGASMEDLTKEFLMNYGLSPATDKSMSDFNIFKKSFTSENKTMILENKTDEDVDAKLFYFEYGKGIYRLQEDLIDDKVIMTGVRQLKKEDSVAYDRVEHEGSYLQNPIGFIFGERPLTKDLGKTPAPVAKVKASSPMQETLNFSANTMEATESSIKVTKQKEPSLNFSANVGNQTELDFGQASPERVESQEVIKQNKSSLSDLVSAWLQTKEGSLDNQTSKESASRFVSEYTKRQSQLTDTGETVEELREKRKKMSRQERLQDAGQL